MLNLLQYNNNHCRQKLRRNASTTSSIDTLSSVSSSSYLEDDNTSSIIIRNNIPKMELLKINYVNKNVSKYKDQVDDVAATTRDETLPYYKDKKANVQYQNANITADQQQSYNQLKYVVYKKHNDIDRLQYISDDLITSFTNRKRTTDKNVSLRAPTFCKPNNHFDSNIKYGINGKTKGNCVENKLYGIIGEVCKRSTEYANKSASPKMDVSRIKQLFENVSPTSVSRPKSMNDLHIKSKKIEQTAGSLKKVKKLVDNFDNRCSCSEFQHHDQQNKQKTAIDHTELNSPLKPNSVNTKINKNVDQKASSRQGQSQLEQQSPNPDKLNEIPLMINPQKQQTKTSVQIGKSQISPSPNINNK